MSDSDQARARLEQHFRDQLAFIEASCDGYDRGFEGEAKRIALALRVLAHDQGMSRSLLGQLGLLSTAFHSTAVPINPHNRLSHAGLVAKAIRGAQSRYVPLLDTSPTQQMLPFTNWWTMPVFMTGRREVMTREDVVLVVANQDGGAHVDPSVDELYEEISQRNGLRWIAGFDGGEIPLPDPVRPSLRQIGHEVLKTFRPGYQKSIEYDADMFVLDAELVQVGSSPPPLQPSRNAPCPCGSKKRYKHCHGSKRH